MQDSQTPLSPKDTSFMDIKAPNTGAPNPTSRPIVGGQNPPQPDPMISTPPTNPAATAAPVPVPVSVATPFSAAPEVAPSAEPVGNVSEPLDTPSISGDDGTVNSQNSFQPVQPAPLSANPTPAPQDIAATPDHITAQPTTTTPTDKPKKKSLVMDFTVIVVLLLIIIGLIYIIKFKSSSL
jgi:hypothetical protein